MLAWYGETFGAIIVGRELKETEELRRRLRCEPRGMASKAYSSSDKSSLEVERNDPGDVKLLLEYPSSSNWSKVGLDNRTCD